MLKTLKLRPIEAQRRRMLALARLLPFCFLYCSVLSCYIILSIELFLYMNDVVYIAQMLYIKW